MAKEKGKPVRPLPQVQVAAFCENILEEKDGIYSAIRIVNRFTIVSMPPEVKGASPAIFLKALLILKAGKATGKRIIKIVVIKPSGRKTKIAKLPILFEGEEHGVTVKLELGIVLEGEGLYRCHVYVGKTRLTELPFRIVYPKPESQTTEHKQSPPDGPKEP